MVLGVHNESQIETYTPTFTTYYDLGKQHKT